MAQDYSFDAVSEIDLNLVSEAVQVALKEITNRFDFKDAEASYELDQKAKKLIVRAKSEYQVEAAFDVLMTRMAKRGISLKGFKKGEIVQALGQTARMEVEIKAGIPTDKAKEISAALKEKKLKVNPTIQGEQLRITSKSKDELQAAMAFLRAGSWELDLQFKNFR